MIFAGVSFTAAVARRVSVATPESRCRKLSATRSPASKALATPRTVATVVPASTQEPSVVLSVIAARQSSSRNTVVRSGKPAITSGA